MNNKNILYVYSEVSPYMPEETFISKLSYEIARSLNAQGAQIRIFIPRYGHINERRHQLHEVIRLSGMNLVVNDTDMPLMVKVASIPKERIQVYFIDNDDFFKDQEVEEKTQDKDERCIFFAKGTVETIKKLNWTPDVIHIQGWLGSLLPMYLRTFYKDDNIFSQSKVVTSVFKEEFEGSMSKNLLKKISFDGITKKEAKNLGKTAYDNLMKNAIDFSDAVVFAGEGYAKKLYDYSKRNKKNIMIHPNVEELTDEYANFYDTLIL